MSLAQYPIRMCWLIQKGLATFFSQLSQIAVSCNSIAYKGTQDWTETNMNEPLTCEKQLLRRYPEHSIAFIWFTDEELFTAARPVNLRNDRMYTMIVEICKKQKSQLLSFFVNFQYFPSWWCYWLACHHSKTFLLVCLLLPWCRKFHQPINKQETAICDS